MMGELVKFGVVMLVVTGGFVMAFYSIFHANATFDLVRVQLGLLRRPCALVCVRRVLAGCHQAKGSSSLYQGASFADMSQTVTNGHVNYLSFRVSRGRLLFCNRKARPVCCVPVAAGLAERIPGNARRSQFFPCFLRKCFRRRSDGAAGGVPDDPDRHDAQPSCRGIEHSPRQDRYEHRSRIQGQTVFPITGGHS